VHCGLTAHAARAAELTKGGAADAKRQTDIRKGTAHPQEHDEARDRIDRHSPRRGDRVQRNAKREGVMATQIPPLPHGPVIANEIPGDWVLTNSHLPSGL
jgi:hypothetical protein